MKTADPCAKSLLSLALIAVLVASAAVTPCAAYGPKPKMAPDFTLVDQNRRPFRLSKLRGHPIVLFFGYTHCPDACPTTLAHLARAVREPGVPPDVRVAFITVDPYRDSPANLKRYMDLFDRRFIGLTGSMPTLNAVYLAYDSPRQAVPPYHGRDDYEMAHGTAIYYIGRDGAFKGLGDAEDDMRSITRALKKLQ